MTTVGWSEQVGLSPHAVLVFENLARKGVLYLRWWDPQRRNKAGDLAPNWRVRSLERVLVPTTGPDGKPLNKRERERAADEAKQWARRQAEAQYLILAGKVAAPVVDPAPAPRGPLGILAGLALAIDPEAGKYPADTLYRRDVVVAVQQASAVWGADFPWESVRRAQWTQFWRARIRAVQAKGKDGLSAARHAVERVHVVAQWLRDHEHIDGGAVLPKTWREDVAKDFAQIAGGELPEVQRPRHTADEMRRILTAAMGVEPRLALLLALGAELRAGQVLRAWRSDLVLAGPQAGTFGRFTVRGRGKKGGVTIDLTRGQRAAVDLALGLTDPARGYLRALEAAHQSGRLADYRLFAGGPLTARARWTKRTGSRPVDPYVPAEPAARAERPVHTRRMAHWFAVAETTAGVTPQPGRALYGLRRAAVDAATALNVSPEALQQMGGWADRRTPEDIYRDRELVVGREEARDARARIRGEASDEPEQATPEAVPNPEAP